MSLTPSSSPWWVLGAHLTMSAGLGLMFTPLFTSALGALPPHRYSHGSAVVGTAQQVAGAAGTALFVTVLTAQQAALVAGGTSATAATAGGLHAAFLVGAVLSLLVVPAALLIRRPEHDPHGAPDDAEAIAHV